MVPQGCVARYSRVRNNHILPGGSKIKTLLKKSLQKRDKQGYTLIDTAVNTVNSCQGQNPT